MCEVDGAGAVYFAQRRKYQDDLQLMEEHAGYRFLYSGSQAMPLEIVVGAVVGAAAASAVTSESMRRKLRQGAVYGLAGLLVAYDKVAALTQGAVDGARQVVKEASEHPATSGAASTNGATSTNGAATNGTVPTPTPVTAPPG